MSLHRLLGSVAARAIGRFGGLETPPEMEVVADDIYLNDRQRRVGEDYLQTVGLFGKFQQGATAEGAHYIRADQNPFVDDGIICDNCIFYEPGDEDDQRAWKTDLPIGNCQLVEQVGTEANYIHPYGLCKLWVIPEALMNWEPFRGGGCQLPRRKHNGLNGP
tara:strand:- start:8807 stop:9292 length:486 start_codon:yes stop_codon:yes gene_type:complete